MIARRQFITLLAAAAWPLGAHGQPTATGTRIGILGVARASPTTAPSWRAFFDELSAHGFRLNDNLLVEMRWVDEDARGPDEVAAELVRSSVDVLVVEGQKANLKAAVAATGTIPIVMTVGAAQALRRRKKYQEHLLAIRLCFKITSLALYPLQRLEKAKQSLVHRYVGT